MVSLQLRCLCELWLKLQRFKHILKKICIWPQWLHRFASLPCVPGRDTGRSSEGWMLPCYFSRKEQTPLARAGPFAVLGRAAGAVLPSCQRMVAALQQSVLWSMLFSECPGPLWISTVPESHPPPAELSSAVPWGGCPAPVASWCHL